jgi:hypothetical protein
MIDGVILVALLVPAFVAIASFMFGNEGTKGITNPYVTKRGVRHTAKRSRTDYIV